MHSTSITAFRVNKGATFVFLQ